MREPHKGQVDIDAVMPEKMAVIRLWDEDGVFLEIDTSDEGSAPSESRNDALPRSGTGAPVRSGASGALDRSSSTPCGCKMPSVSVSLLPSSRDSSSGGTPS